jgi:hypothetical protein
MPRPSNPARSRLLIEEISQIYPQVPLFSPRNIDFLYVNRMQDGIRPYRLLPLFRMEKLGITIQIDQAPVGPESFVNYVYPFDNLPDFDSHIHPKFAILALGKKLLEMETKSIVAKRVALNKLLEKFPILEEVRRLYTAWTAIPDAKDVAADGSYAAPDNDSDDEEDSKPDFDNYDDDSDYKPDYKSTSSVKTKPRRVRDKKQKRANTPPDYDSDDDEDSEPDINCSEDSTDSDNIRDNKSTSSVRTPPRRVGVKKRKRANTSPALRPRKHRNNSSLCREALVEHERAVGKGGWTAEQVANWGQQLEGA